MNKFIYTLAVLASGLAFAQTGKVGINTENPTETLQIQGTARITDLPINETGLISTNTDGTESTARNQTFSATKTLVVDNNGVVGAIDGLPVMEVPEYKNVPFASKSVTIGSATPEMSVVRLGNIEVRFDGTNPTGGEESVSFRIHNDAVLYGRDGNESPYDLAIVNTMKIGAANKTVTGTQDWVVDGMKGMDWWAIGYNKPNVWQGDFVQYMISLLNTKELYRISVQVNRYWEGKYTNADGRVTIFVEKLTNFE